MNHFLIINIFTCLSAIHCQVYLAGSSSNHPLSEIAQEITELGYTVHIWDLQFIESVEDSIDNINNGILIWEQDAPFSESEVIAVDSFLERNGHVILFGNSWSDNLDFLAEHFGLAFLRETDVNYLTNDETQENIYFLSSTTISELSLVGENSTPIFSFNQGTGITVIKQHSGNSGIAYASGFWLEELNDQSLESYLNSIFQDIFNPQLFVEINHQSGSPGDSIDIEFSIVNNAEVTSFESIVLIDPEYLSNYEIEPTERSIGMEWTIEDLPFGLIKINAEFQNDAISPGVGPVATISGNIHNNGAGKISLEFIEVMAESNTEEFSISTENGQIDLEYAAPVITLEPPQFITPGDYAQILLEMNNEIPVYGFQICMTFEDSLLLFVEAEPTDRIPSDWWVGQFGEGSNAQIQIAGFGFQNIEPGTGPLLTVNALSTDSSEVSTQVGFCDVFLLSEDSQYLDYQAFGTTVEIEEPSISISKYAIQSTGYTDILINYDAVQSFSGYQLDVSGVTNETDFHPYYACEAYINLIEGNMSRITGFYTDYGHSFPEEGTLMVLSMPNEIYEDVFVESNSVLFSNFAGESLYAIVDNTMHFSSIVQDVNADGQVDVFDLLAIRLFVNNELQIGNAQFENADINNDGSLDILDMAILLQNLINSVTE